MLNESEASGICTLPEHDHPDTYYFDPVNKLYGQPWPTWLSDGYGSRMQCMWKVAMTEFIPRKADLEKIDGVLYVYGNGYALTEQGVKWHSEIGA